MRKLASLPKRRMEEGLNGKEAEKSLIIQNKMGFHYPHKGGEIDECLMDLERLKMQQELVMRNCK